MTSISAKHPARTRKLVAVAKHDGIDIPKGLNVGSTRWGAAHIKLASEVQKKHHMKDQSGAPTLELRRFLFPKPKPTPKREKAIHAAMTQLGVHEVPMGSNGGPQVDQYTRAGEGRVIHEAWCGDFVKWCSDKAGINLPRFYYPRAKAWAENLPHVSQADAELGDVVIFRWASGSFHVARLVEFLDTPSGKRIKTVDGNRSDRVGIFTTDVNFVYAIVRTHE